MGKVVEKIIVGHDIEKPNSIMAFVSGDRTEQLDYIEGLIGIGSFLLILVTIWFLTLLLLKCQGRDKMGCSAGYAFHDSESDSRSVVNARKKRRGVSGTLFQGDGQDVSVGAAVDPDDSVARDDSPRRGRKTSSSSNRRTRLSSMPKIASVFGKERTKESRSEHAKKAPSEKNNTPFSYIYDSRVFNEIELQVEQKNNTPTTERTTTPKSHISDGRNANEIELHMELDKIIQSATEHTELNELVRSATLDSEAKWKAKLFRSTTQDSKSKWKEKNNGDKVWSLHSIPKTVRIGDESSTEDDSSDNRKYRSIEKTWGDTWLCSSKPEHVERRKFQTRSVFALFAMISLMSCALLVTHMYKPLEAAALSSSDVIQETAIIVDELNGVLEILDEAATATVVMVETTPLDYELICPGFSVENFQNQFGFNPQTMIETVSEEYQTYVPTIVNLLNKAKGTGDSVTNMLLDVDEAVRSTNEVLWIIPLIICITMLIIFSQLALMFAVVYREQKFKDIQTTTPKVENCYAWTVLPLQVFAVVASWVLVIAFCFGMVITTDSCIPSFGAAAASGATDSRGTPDDVVLAVMDQYLVSSRSGGVEAVAKERLATYITGCGGMESDPLAEVIVIQKLLQESMEEIDTQLSFTNDVLGIQFVEQECGLGNRVRDFFSSATALNRKFDDVNMAIKLGYDALSCPRVNSLYIDAVHGAFCTDFATANANGLILLVMISFSGMVLITLRASWRSSE